MFKYIRLLTSHRSSIVKTGPNRRLRLFVISIIYKTIKDQNEL